jgi:RNA polymerase sigma factor (sigma-70 family)
VLTREAFDRLLARLDSNRDCAGERYEVLRHKLIIFSAANGCTSPETFADEVLTRITRRIDEGEQVRDVSSYALGVARLLLREIRKQERRENDAYEAASHAVSAPDETARLERIDYCVETCLAELTPEGRRLVLAYYAADRREKIDGRRELAARLGIPTSALRLRVHRLRARLTRCVLRCLDEEPDDVS